MGHCARRSRCAGRGATLGMLMHVLKRGGSVNESARRYVCIEERRLHERIRAVMKWLLHGNEIRLILTQTLRNCTQNAPSLPRSQLAMGHTNRGKLDEQVSIGILTLCALAAISPSCTILTVSESIRSLCALYWLPLRRASTRLPCKMLNQLRRLRLCGSFADNSNTLQGKEHLGSKGKDR